MPGDVRYAPYVNMAPQDPAFRPVGFRPHRLTAGMSYHQHQHLHQPPPPAPPSQQHQQQQQHATSLLPTFRELVFQSVAIRWFQLPRCTLWIQDLFHLVDGNTRLQVTRITHHLRQMDRCLSPW